MTTLPIFCLPIRLLVSGQAFPPYSAGISFEQLTSTPLSALGKKGRPSTGGETAALPQLISDPGPGPPSLGLSFPICTMGGG